MLEKPSCNIAAPELARLLLPSRRPNPFNLHFQYTQLSIVQL